MEKWRARANGMFGEMERLRTHRNKLPENHTKLDDTTTQTQYYFHSFLDNTMSTAQPPPQPTKEEADMTQALAQDRPTIDAAIKSYISLVCAKALTASATDNVVSTNTTALVPATPSPTTIQEEPKTLLGLIPSAGLDNNNNNATTDHNNNNNSYNQGGVQQQVLQLARILLQTLNQYTFPIHCTVANSKLENPTLNDPQQKLDILELSITSQLWNGLVQSKQKPSRFLGRRALRQAWKQDLEMEVKSKIQEPQQLQWLQEFERLLFADNSSSSSNVDDDSALLWAPDGGTAELAKRQERRKQAATQRSANNNNNNNNDE